MVWGERRLRRTRGGNWFSGPLVGLGAIVVEARVRLAKVLLYQNHNIYIFFYFWHHG